ncbi:hypothetical protein GDO86_016483 [Hymenochirus boettgeri]|uniref:Mitogen-activated protein kinase kinase kinase n=1 Tax=Hymenochirus boettgeri TaxID=247094 RepID=A0A8T2JX92_9PIPI|nr:hypothetical protein GDO86_016483 [Hymenochirus boettgeri]
MQELPPGDLFNLQRVGEGGFGQVFRGWSQSLGMEVALKVCEKEGRTIEEIEKEREMMHRANFTYVLRLLAVCDTPNGIQSGYGLVMEFMPHGSLHTLFQQVPDVPWALRFRILHQVALGMNYLHHILVPPIIHRDLKPANVLLSKVLDVQLTDFGLSKNLISTKSVSLDCMAGTLAYMPPEAFDVNYLPTKYFDVYSFGILTWSVLSGQQPYPNAPSALIMHQIPQGNRPDIHEVIKWKSVKMVPKAIDIMTKCWDSRADNRPSFRDCLPVTQSMFNEYTGEVDTAVQEVLTCLQGTGTQSSSSVDIRDRAIPLETSDFSGILGRIRDSVDTPPPAVKNFKVPEDAVEFLRKNLANIVKSKPELSSILRTLLSEKIINEEELDVIMITGTVENQIRETLRHVMNKGKRSSIRFLELLSQHHRSLLESF